MFPTAVPQLRFTIALFACFGLAACAINPATGKRQLVLVSEAQEKQLGLENDQAVVAQMGLYPDEALQQYIHDLGRNLAARSERPELDWTFRVVDDPIVNAFALPGGYIYMTRGILAHFNNEAELVSVLGHEIGHVTARHSVSQMSKAQLAQIGMGLGTVLAPEQAQQFGELASMGLSMLFLKYSRDDERQADDLGLRYALRGGYDPRPMADVFDTLDRVSEAAGGGDIPGWMSTHPLPQNRRERILEQIATLDPGASGTTVKRDEYLDRLEGMTFGEDPRDGYFKDELFVHPEMEFQLRFPNGWKTQNSREAVGAVSPEQDAIVLLSLARQPTAREALAQFFSQEGVTSTGPAMGAISGLPTAGDGFRVATTQGAVRGRVGFVEYRGVVFQLLAYTSEDKWASYEDTMRSALASFDRLRDARAKQAEPKRLRIVRPSRSMDVEAFAKAYGASVPVEVLVLINRLDDGERLEAGRPYKIVTGGLTP